MDSLLATKINIPSLPSRRVKRTFVLNRLADGFSSGRQITLVSAPAGFGKTTCVREWIETLSVPVAWLSLDPADDEPVRFFTYFFASLQKASPAACKELPAILSSGPLPPAEDFSVYLINDLMSLREPLMVVVDDFHFIQNQFILDVFEKLVAGSLSTFYLTIITREDPALPLSRLRAHNRLNEIRAAMLRFSPEEADLFLSQIMQLSLSPAEVNTLEERTEGWVVGLQLAGLSLRDRRDSAGFIAGLSGSQRFILSYLTEEVLQQQTPQDQHFLLRTSILEKFNAEICDKISGQKNSQERLEKFFAANLFIVPLDDEGGWFRYHHLFADLLRAKLRQAVPVEQITKLHEEAAGWYDQHGLIVEASDQYLAAGNFDALARLIEKYAYVMMTHGELATLLRWSEMLPEVVLHSHPMILIIKAWTFALAGTVHQVEPLLHKMERIVEGDDSSPVARDLNGNVAAIRAFFYMMSGAYAKAIELAGLADQLLPQSSVQARSMLPYTFGASFRGQGDYARAVQSFTDEIEMGIKYGDLITWATGVTEVINVKRLQGKNRDALQIGRDALLRMAEGGAGRFASIAKIEVAYCQVLVDQDLVEEAGQRIRAVIERLSPWSMPTDRLFAYLALVQIQFSRAEYDDAGETIRLARDIRDTQPVLPILARTVDVWDVRTRLQKQNLEEAASLAAGLHLAESDIVPLKEQDTVLLARLKIARHETAVALHLLDDLAQNAGPAGHWRIYLEARILQAIIQYSMNNLDEAVQLILEACNIAMPEVILRPFIDEGRSMASLLQAALPCFEKTENNVETLNIFIGSILSSIDGSLDANIILPMRNISSASEPLTVRELEVLHLIVAGLKYEEIGVRLFISVNTVRTYVKSIYRKLDVDSRSRAIETAHRLNIA